MPSKEAPMSNAILLNWINLSGALSGLTKKEQPLGSGQMKKTFGNLVSWYEQFTDISPEQLGAASKQYGPLVKQASKKVPDSIHGAVYCAVDFLHSYLEPVEIVNMYGFGASRKDRAALVSMKKGMERFHIEKMDSLGWLVEWLEKVDPLFPAQTVKNKLACCFAGVDQKHCFTNARQCIYEPRLSWIRTPSVTLAGLAANDDCCLGSTLSSCSGGTLTCDCVSGNTGCDCKAPNKLCGQNDKSMDVTASGFSDVYCQALDPREEIDSAVRLACLVLDAASASDCMLDGRGMTYKGPLSRTLDVAKGRFMVSRSGIPFNLGRLVMKAADCQQTGFCPPKSGGCGGLC
ncbi:MAG: hypothetical protein OQK59_03795 [Chlorobium sp.]|nr:hypothetical protein [Chlorobium sp.]